MAAADGGKRKKAPAGPEASSRLGVVRDALKDHVVVQVACGPATSYAVTAAGVLFSWGSAAHGALGHAGCDPAIAVVAALDRPAAVEALVGRHVVQVAAGARHLVVLDADGRVYTCGFAGYARLGLKDTRDKYTPQPVTALAHIRVVHVAAGAEHTAVLGASGGPV